MEAGASAQSTAGGWKHAIARAVNRDVRRLILALAFVFEIVKWVWGTVLLGGIGVTILTTLAQSGMSGMEQWIVFQWLDAHRDEGMLIGGCALIVLLGVTYVTWQASRVPFVQARRAGFKVIPVNELSLRDSLFKGAHKYEDFYYFPRAYSEAVERIRAIRAGSAQGKRGIVIRGDTMVGKTRLALEVIRRELRGYELWIWESHWSRRELAAFRGARLVLFLDDLQSLVEQQQAHDIQEAFFRLQDITDELIVVATSWGGTYWDEVTARFKDMDAYLYTVTVPKLNEDEARVFRVNLDEHGIKYDWHDWDWTPGSVLLGLGRRIEQLASMKQLGSMGHDARAILEALRLLRYAGVLFYPEPRIRRVAQDLFEMPPQSRGRLTLPRTAREFLQANGWITVTTVRGIRHLQVPADAYLDRCVKTIYPIESDRIEDDYDKLMDALSNGGAEESDALFALSGAYLKAELLGEERYARALEAIEHGLRPLTRAQHPQLWADGQLRLARLYREHPAGDPHDNRRLAIAAYSESLAAQTAEQFPSDPTTPSSALHTATFRRLTNESPSITEAAIEALTLRLEELDREASRGEWAGLRTNLGTLYLYRRYGRLAENLEQAVGEYDQALTAYGEAPEHAYESALARMGRGIALAMRSAGERARAAEATEELTRALDILDKRGSELEQALVLSNRGLARVYAQDAGAVAADFDKAISLLGLRAALEAERSLVYVRQGMAYLYLAEEPDDLRQAIEKLDAARSTLKQEEFRLEWSLAGGYRGIAHATSLAGHPAINAAEAVRDIERALHGIPYKDYPYEWALMRWHLGAAYQRIPGDREESLNLALQAYQTTLVVFTREQFPIEWAMTQQAIAAVYLQQALYVRGSDPRHARFVHREHLHAAREAYDQALAIFVRDAYPLDWAALQSNLAVATWRDGAGVAALELAAKGLEEALAVFAEQRLPIEVATVRNNLAALYLGLGELDPAERLIEDALKTFTTYELAIQRATAQNNLAALRAIRVLSRDPGDNKALAEARDLNTEAQREISRADYPNEWARVAANEVRILEAQAAHDDTRKRQREEEAKRLQATLSGFLRERQRREDERRRDAEEQKATAAAANAGAQANRGTKRRQPARIPRPGLFGSRGRT